MKIAIVNAHIVTRDHLIKNGAICFENGVITSVGESVDSFDQRIDAEGKYLVPGFVDLHCHGCLGHAFNDADPEKTNEIARFHLSRGTTTMLASTSTAHFSQLEEAGFYLDDMFVEIIADGKHLPPELLRLVYKIKGADRTCLVTDATRAAGLADGSITKNISGSSDVLVEDGVAKMPDRSCFAGSAATADRLYRTMADAIGRDMVALSRMASLTPARLMGWEDRGEIAVGKRADLVLLDENLYPQRVFLGGKKV